MKAPHPTPRIPDSGDPLDITWADCTRAAHAVMLGDVVSQLNRARLVRGPFLRESLESLGTVAATVCARGGQVVRVGTEWDIP